MHPSLSTTLKLWSDTIKLLAGIRQGNTPRIGLKLNDLGPLPHTEFCIWAIWTDRRGADSRTQRRRSKLAAGFLPASRRASYLRWLPAPMNNSMGIDNMKLTREARSAVRPHWAISAGAGVPWAAAVTAAIILFWFGHITAWTLAIMMIPKSPPIPSAIAPVPPLEYR